MLIKTGKRDDDIGGMTGERENGEEMGRSRRKYKKSRSKGRGGLPKKKNPHVFKPLFPLPPKLRSFVDSSQIKWNDKGNVMENYTSFGEICYTHMSQRIPYVKLI
ncbi:unnamed protein product [Ilex paraguariensis]|uniref:Uncharacterized protein n=1 Tax=Ilex paraguariensis TaxID=185542 RepID=A0ABC8RYC7_9AQUA